MAENIQSSDLQKALPWIENAIKSQLNKEIEIEFEKAIKIAEQRIVERRSEIVSAVLIAAYKIMSMSSNGHEIIFRINTDDKK